MWGDIPFDEWTDAIEQTAEELLWEAGVAEPPVDAFLIALRLGVLVAEDDALEARAQLVRVAGEGAAGTATATPLVVLGDDDRFERRQFAVAHELGEFVAPRVFERLAIDPRHTPTGSREQVANALAGRLLLPRRWFKKHGLAWDWDLLALKDTFWTASHELIARRMLDMSPPVVITIFDQGHLSWRRSNWVPGCAPLTDDERQCWQECHLLGTESAAAAASPVDGVELAIRCWPVHEPGWQREIMRTGINAVE